MINHNAFKILKAITCKLCWLSFLMATTTGSSLIVVGLTLPLYTDPKPPSPIFNILLKPFVASISSWREKTLKLCSFSLYNSGILLDGNEFDGLKPFLVAELLDLSPWFNSGADLDILLDLDFPFGLKKHFIFLNKLIISDRSKTVTNSKG